MPKLKDYNHSVAGSNVLPIMTMQLQKRRFRIMILLGLGVLMWISTTVLAPSGERAGPARSSEVTLARKTSTMTVPQFEYVNKRLMVYEKEQEECGWVRDCARRYRSTDVDESASVEHTKDISEFMDLALLTRKRKALMMCSEELKTSTGGYCYGNMRPGPYQITLPYPDRAVTLPKGKLRPNQKFIDAMINFLTSEHVKSLSDFGAGLGGYGSPLVRKFPNLLYYGYDGAGDIEDRTNGFIKYFDLTLPLHLPITDWVMSIEVGEHISAEYEGMVVRNIHTHNCKGVILTWADLGQGGNGHINNHSRDYLIAAFEDLNYVVDQRSVDSFKGYLEKGFLHKNIVIFRRKSPVC